MKRTLVGWQQTFTAAFLGSALCAAPALAAEPEPYDIQAVEEQEFGEPLFDSAPVAYDVAQPADGMESMGMGMASPAPAARTPTSRRIGASGTRQANIRLASVPNMFGDFGMSQGQLISLPDATGQNRTSFGVFDVPTSGGSRRVKIGENNVAMPSDRVYFMYNHFHNVFQIDETPITPPGPRNVTDVHVDRYTVGFEKMFLDDLWSIEVRMPFNSSFDYEGVGIGIDGGNVGNVAVILKNLLYVDESLSVAGGVAIDAPTGSDVDLRLATLMLNLQNDAFHILPWIGFAKNFDDLFFATGFAQLDLATNGNEITARNFQNRRIGVYNEQNLAYFDLSAGVWVYRDPTARRLTSVSVQGEIHYTTTIQDSDVIDATIANVPFSLSNIYNRQDIFNGTVALQFEIANKSTFRIACVSPLSESDDGRVFDAEVQVQYNRRF